jgi:hypothetical protein
LIHTFEFVNVFPIKTNQNYFREEMDANQLPVISWLRQEIEPSEILTGSP